MYYIESDLGKKKYLAELRRSFRNPFLIFDERVCGIVVGPFFSVAYHSPYEWNRRITSECNRAWGYVRERDGKTEVRFLLGKGLLSPFWILFYTTVCLCIFFCAMGRNGWTFSDIGEFWLVALIGVVMSLIACGVTAIESSLTEQGMQGQNTLIYLLEKPDQYY